MTHQKMFPGAHLVDFDGSHPLPARGRPLWSGRPNLSAAVIAGLAAATVSFITLLMFSTSLYDESAWKLPRMLAAVFAGRGALQPDDEFSITFVALGILVFFAMALACTYVLAALVKDMPDAAAPWIGMTFGVGLYFGNLYGFARVFEWLAPLRTLDTLAVHVLFGIIAATAYRHLAAPSRH